MNDGATAVRYAGFWRRAAAAMLDTLLYSLVSTLLVAWLVGSAYFQPDAAQTPWYPVVAFFNQLLPAVVTVALWRRFLATPGKLLLGCRVVDARTGQRVGVGQAVLRYLGYIVSALPLFLGFLWIAWDRRKQGFHDKIANTLVVIEPDDSVKTTAQLEREAAA